MRNRFVINLAAAVAALLAILAAASPARADDALRNEFYRSLAARSAHAARAAEEGPTALLVTGVIGRGSYDEFRAAVARSSPTLVVLDGPGGILGEALQIGEEVRRLNLDTMIGPHHRCASACAVVFLSGHTKYLGRGAAVGLHSAAYADGRADPEATAIMADYLREVGVPNATLTRMAHTAPSDIRWLTRAELRTMGIRLLNGNR